MAVLSAGLTIGYYGPELYKQKVGEYLEMFWEDAAVAMLARFAVVNSLVPALNLLPWSKPIDHRYRLILSWGSLRGAVAIALAMSLPKHFPYRWQIIDFAFGVTLFTLLVIGKVVYWPTGSDWAGEGNDELPTAFS